MKKLILSAAVVASIFTACKKETIQPQNPADTSVQVPQEKKTTYHYHGNEVTLDFLKGLTTENHWFIAEINGSLTYNIFDTEVELQNFAKTTPYASAFASKFEKVQAARQYAATHNSIASFESTGAVPADYTQYLASINGASKTAGVGYMADDLDGGGTLFPISGNPQATLPGFDNRAESAYGLGLANTIYEKTFFRGSTRYIFLAAGGWVINFDTIGFQNVTSSCW
jgi:hypothetical protein